MRNQAHVRIVVGGNIHSPATDADKPWDCLCVDPRAPEGRAAMQSRDTQSKMTNLRLRLLTRLRRPVSDAEQSHGRSGSWWWWTLRLTRQRRDRARCDRRRGERELRVVLKVPSTLSVYAKVGPTRMLSVSLRGLGQKLPRGAGPPQPRALSFSSTCDSHNCLQFTHVFVVIL